MAHMHCQRAHRNQVGQPDPPVLRGECDDEAVIRFHGLVIATNVDSQRGELKDMEHDERKNNDAAVAHGLRSIGLMLLLTG